MTFSQPDPDVLFALTGYAGMMESANGMANPSQLVQHPAGSGPYKLVSLSAANTYSLDRFDGYWNKSHVYPATEQQQNIVDETTRLNAVKTGTLAATYVTGLTYTSALADKSLQLEKYNALTEFTVFMNDKIHPLDNSSVRQAISLALNRDAMNASQDGVCPPVYQAFTPGMDGYIKGFAPATNVAQAKQLIQSAGATGATLKMVTIPNEPFATLAKLTQAQLDDIGLNVQIVTQPGAVYRVQFAQGQYPLMFAQTSISNPDPSAVLDQFVISPANPGTKDPTLVSQIQAAEAMSVGSSQRTAAMQAINRALSTQYYIWAPVCESVDIFVANPKVMGLDAIPSGALSDAPDASYLQISK
jgi:ABC-type transport system substrate-binding protein